MSERRIERIVILGGGTAGWMTAAALAHYVRYLGLSIRLVESESIGTVGVGEATIPGIREFNQKLGIDEQAFMVATGATFKLGIEFIDWSKKGMKYLHPFGFYGHDLNALSFYHYWLRSRAGGNKAPISDYSISCHAAAMSKFQQPNTDPKSVLSRYFYAYHLDAGKYAGYLRRYSESRGVTRTEGNVKTVERDSDTGFIRSLTLESGEKVEGELFIDCSGFRSLLTGKTLGVDFENWSEWLLCDSAVTVASERSESDFTSYTRAYAEDVGWRWRIPLQHRTGNGYVFASDFMDSGAAEKTLFGKLDTNPIGQLRHLKFTPGMRKKIWEKNCVAIGLAAGFLEPLESTGIHLIQAGILRLIKLFPDSQFSEFAATEYNRQMRAEYVQARDFLIAHYKLNTRRDSEFWRYCENMSVPDSVDEKIGMFKRTAQLPDTSRELFVETNWIAILLGQALIPDTYNARADNIEFGKLSEIMQQMRSVISKAVKEMPTHSEMVSRYCPTDISD